MSTFNVTDFLTALEANQPKPREFQDKFRSLEKTYLSFPGNYGKYQILPMNSVVTGLPFVSLSKTREIMMMRKNTLPDGTVKPFESWIKILPKDAYRMRDVNGDVVSSLTSEESALLDQAHQLFDNLYEALDGNSKEKEDNKAIGFLRRRNYTIFFGKCLNKWSFDNARTPEKQNFASLFVCSAKDFLNVIQDNVNNIALTSGNDTEWLKQIYSRDLTGRTGSLIFTIRLNNGGKVGYDVSAQHSYGIEALRSATITEEEAELMKDPVETFLGFQASHDQPGRLFNAKLIKETIEMMASQLRAVQMAKENHQDVIEAFKNVWNTASVAIDSKPVSNDPVIAAAQQQAAPQAAPAFNPANMNVFSNPPAAQIDPMSSQPVAPQSAGNPLQNPFVQGNSNYFPWGQQ